MLGVKGDPPDLDERTAFWISAFNLLCRGRPASMGGLMPLPPLDILETAERLDWPCQPDECLEVIGALDDAYRERNEKASQ